MEKYTYKYNCVSPVNKRDLEVIIDNLQNITYDTFIKYVSLDHLLEIFTSYYKDKRKGLTFKHDWSITYHKSKDINNKVVYILCHSGIEYIFKK
jgi:hypothetical protein